jgi:hypothetical protein
MRLSTLALALAFVAPIGCSSSSNSTGVPDGGTRDSGGGASTTRTDARGSDAARHDGGASDARHEAATSADGAPDDAAVVDAAHDATGPADAAGDAKSHDASKDGSVREGGQTEGGHDASSDAPPDGFVPCASPVVPSCATACHCWVGIPASCFPPGSANYYGAIDDTTCTTYCPTDFQHLGSYCQQYGRLDGGDKWVFVVDSGADAWVYCRSYTCNP